MSFLQDCFDPVIFNIVYDNLSYKVAKPNALPLSRERRVNRIANHPNSAAPLVGCSGLLGGVLTGEALSPYLHAIVLRPGWSEQGFRGADSKDSS